MTPRGEYRGRGNRPGLSSITFVSLGLLLAGCRAGLLESPPVGSDTARASSGGEVTASAVAPTDPVTTASVPAFADLDGWRDDDHRDAFAAFVRSCRKLKSRSDSHAMGKSGGRLSQWRPACAAATTLGARPGRDAARTFFERHFRPVPVYGGGDRNGLFTGYFEPELSGSLTRNAVYSVPLYPRPPDLVAFPAGLPRHPDARGLPRGRIVNGRGLPYYTRRQIDQGALRGKVEPVLYLRSKVDAFFLHIQGSGRVRLPDGRVTRVAFAGKTGLPYTAIGGVLAKNGALARDRISMQTIRQWLENNPARADEVMWHNRSYIFFRRLDGSDPSLGPPGAQGVALTPGRSLAVDGKVHGYGTPVWLETTAPSAAGGAVEPFRRLMIAQDTGTAIRGAVRGDVFWGSGQAAGEIAGRMQNRGRMHVLLPVSVARKVSAVRAGRGG